jgi:L-lactate dehydrogenase complex protein LldE
VYTFSIMSPTLRQRPRRVALFIACLSDQFYPEVGVAIVKILQKLGVEVVFPDEQTCCGQPFFNNGFMPESEKLAKKFIDLFEPYEAIVSPSGSCVAMVREQFHELLKDDAEWSPRMENVRHKTFEFVEFLSNVLNVDLSAYKLPDTTSFTYHYTCHLRGLGLKDEGVRLLKQLGNVDFRELEKTDQCCGFGGTFAVKYPAISGAIVDDKIKCIEKTGATKTVCNDAGCTMNIAGMCNRHGVKTQVTHIALVIAEAMGIDVTSL